ncbi:MAG: PKD domain-containing protein [Ferruginibacter sp.]
MFRFLLVTLLFSTGIFSATAQCPVNIDFELGNFTGWQCYSYDAFYGGVPNPVLTVPTPGRHDMITNPVTSGPQTDYYGGFPVNCPNGSGHSIRIGAASGGHTSDKVSYIFTIPANQNQFSLIYNYAIVLNNGGGHSTDQQPRLEVDVKDLSTGAATACTPLVFAYSPTNQLQGFFTGRPSIQNGSETKCKNWAAASINLDNMAGKTFELSFTTTGCGVSGGSHFGYAYIDVNAECSSSFTGATFCPDDTLVKVTAPYGYQSYIWYNGLHNTVLDNGQILTLKPPPLAGDSVIVEMTPFNGYGCPTTLTAHLWDTLTVTANAGPNKKTCDNKAVQLGGPPKAGLIYKWTPVTGLSDPSISNPFATPSATTQYSLTVTNTGGGCATTAIVTVTVDTLSDSLQLIGSASYCMGSGQSSALKVLPADSIQWYKDGAPIIGANNQLLNITQTGAYYATQFSTGGCTRSTAIKQITIYANPVAGFSVDKPAQCFPGNSFVFTNTSTLASGTPQYSWDMGDGTTPLTTTDVTYSYAISGTYTVKLTVTAPGGCTDDSVFNVTVYPGVTAGFSINQAVQCFKNNGFTFTNTSVASGTPQYNWDMGDGSPILHTTDVAYNYAAPGSYPVRLYVNALGGCALDSSFTVVVNPSPAAGYTINNSMQCFPGHQFVLTNSSKVASGVLQYAWDMGDGVKKDIPDFNYSYATAGAYTIKLLVSTVAGCADSLSKDVTVYPTPSADFTIRPVCENLQVPIINRTYNNTTSTINYLWDFDNGHTDNVKSPVYSYPAGGNYSVKLTVSTVQCPVSFDTKTVDVTIDVPAPGINYPDKDAAFNFPEPLQARNFGTSVTWTPATSLNNRFSYTPSFTGITPQLYTVTIKTATGCVTVDTQFVRTHKKIEIYVPNAFTPDGNGINERLRPVLIGFTKVNYFRIYDRWGKLLFTMNSDQPGWDGKIGNRPAEIQTVVWMIEAVDVDGVVHNKQGTTVLYR